ISPISATPSVTREGVEPSTPRDGHGLLRPACLPFPPPGHSRTVDRGGNRTLIGWLPASCLPVRRHAQDLCSGPGGTRTHIRLFVGQVLSQLSYKAMRECSGRGHLRLARPSVSSAHTVMYASCGEV